jgi:hypothetical protein
MKHARTVAVTLGAVLLAAAPALAQTRPISPLPGTSSTSPSTLGGPSTGTQSPTLTPAPPVGVPSAIDPSTGLPTSQPQTGFPSTSPNTGLPGGGLTSPPPPLAPAPVPLTGPPRPTPPAGQPITPSTVDPRTGLPR